jgi:hypothetical protein
MKQVSFYAIALFIAMASISSCGNRGNEAGENGEQKVNVSDSRRNTPGTVNTITGDSSKETSDSAQHGDRDKNRENM